MGADAPICVLHEAQQAVISVASFGAPRGVEHERSADYVALAMMSTAGGSPSEARSSRRYRRTSAAW